MNRNQVYEFLCRIAAGIAAIFGDNCETVIHEIHSDGSITNLAIWNGHVSGRTAGSTTGIIDRTLQDTSRVTVDSSKDMLNQQVLLRGGRTIKSSTFFVRGDDFTYALGINYDVTVMKKMETVLSSITAMEGDLYESMNGAPISPGSQLDYLFQGALKQLGKPVEAFNKQDRLDLIRILSERNFFQIQKSVPYLSEHLGVSKYTIYKYLKELGLD